MRIFHGPVSFLPYDSDTAIGVIDLDTAPQYGRGVFDAHTSYVEYMEYIVGHPNYDGMPGARQAGRIMWQVSSGRTTSFFKYYQQRWDWWAAKADMLRLPGSGNGEERFSIAARKIHPSGYRPCRLCGAERNVGYFYLNARLASQLAKLRVSGVAQAQPISEALESLRSALGNNQTMALLDQYFPERHEFFMRYGYSGNAFEHSNYLRSTWLSPGFMCNPPDRLDGFHDYCLGCRAKSDPGRSTENLRSYTHDRRAFEWWAEGDWLLADALYNSAGPGRCNICGTLVECISPDHPGPLACGFKHMPVFIPTCHRCNSTKNRRMRESDVRYLCRYEKETGESTASWQVRYLWDAYKHQVDNDKAAKALSGAMREVQHYYLTVLHDLLELGQARFLSTLLRPECAFYDIEFEKLDSSRLTFASYTRKPNRSPLRKSLARRSVRVAFEELRSYGSKGVDSRRFGRNYQAYFGTEIPKILGVARSLEENEADKAWEAAVSPYLPADEQELRIGALLELRNEQTAQGDKKLRSLLNKLFENVALVPLRLS